MARDVTALGGHQADADQIPVSLVQLNIPGFTTTTEVWGTAPKINHGGGYSIGAASIAVNGLGSGTIPQGACFKLGGYFYTLTAPATITTGAATLAITPGLVVAAADQDPLKTIAFNLCDLDVTVYLNPSTNAVSMVSGAGLVPFIPYAGLVVPQMENVEVRITTNVTLSLANEDGWWYAVNAQNLYRETLASIWQGNLLMPAGTAPDAVTFTGVVKTWAGRIEFINALHVSASIDLSPHITPFTILFPYRTYSPPEFKHLPAPGAKLKFGYTEREI